MNVQVGDGVTFNCGSDRYPLTVTAILSPRRIVIQRDNAKRTDNNGYGGEQVWLIIPDPEGVTEIITKRKNGSWHREGESMSSFSYTVGHRSRYDDPSF